LNYNDNKNNNNLNNNNNSNGNSLKWDELQLAKNEIEKIKLNCEKIKEPKTPFLFGKSNGK
jgi:hypothetical protein